MSESTQQDGFVFDSPGAQAPPRVVEGVPVAEHAPVARVRLSLGLPHLDRPFEYLVPASLAEQAQPGVRVVVTFSGRKVDGFVTARTERAEHQGRLELLGRVVSPERVLTPEVLETCRRVAQTHVGNLDDVLRLAVPPRHATAEKGLPLEAPADPPTEAPSGTALEAQTSGVADTDRTQAAAVQSERAQSAVVQAGVGQVWGRYPAGAALLRRLAAGESPAASWVASPAQTPTADWPAAAAHAAAATLASGRGALLVLPDHRDVARVDAALTAVLGEGRHVRLTADQGPSARYTAWLKVLRGHVRCVVGTRAAAFAPVRDLGLVAWWNDGDSSHAEPHAPYPHVRDVLRTRREVESCALLVGGFTRTAYVEAWCEEGWLPRLGEDPSLRRRRIAPVQVAGENPAADREGPGAHARIPTLAWRVIKSSLEHGPVLVQVPRRGYVPSVACTGCGLTARCPDCHGPLSFPAADAPPTCRWCAVTVPRYQCPECHGYRLRATVVGADRTAEELGRAFPGTVVRFSGGTDIKESVPATPALVVATPGAEPLVPGGYAATVILDAWATLSVTGLEAGEQALSRWMRAAALTRPRAAGGRVVLAGVPDSPALTPVEGLVRWDPEWFAARELDDRRGLDLPPLAWTATLTGEFGAIADALGDVKEELTAAGARVLGPTPVPAGAAAAQGTSPGPSGGGAPEESAGGVPAQRAAERASVALVSCAPQAAAQVAVTLRAVVVTRAARKDAQVNVRVGVPDLP